jgi:uncharacterized small protein (DUF1192 family)
MRKSDRRYLHRAVGHPLVQDTHHVLSDARLSADAKLVYLALLSLSDPSGRVCATEQEIARRAAAIQDELEWGDSGMLVTPGTPK